MHIANKGRGEIVVQIADGDTQELREIARDIMPEWLDMFARKNADYGSEGAKVLGIKGQYADINRKMLKLKRGLWDDEPMNFEQPEEICLDLIGHLFLTVQMLREKDRAEREAVFGDGSMDDVRALVNGHLKDAAEASLQKQVQDAFTAGRLSMMPTAAEQRATYDDLEDFTYSEKLQQDMLAERMAYARRIELEHEVRDFESMPMSDQLNRLADGNDGFVETSNGEEFVSGEGRDHYHKSLKVELNKGTFEIEPDGSIYKVPADGGSHDRIPMVLVPASDLKYVASLGRALEEESHIV